MTEQERTNEILANIFNTNKKDDHGAAYYIFMFFAIIFLLALSLVVFAAGTALEGYVMCKCWAWFVMPVFTTMPALPLLPAIGIAFLVSLIAHQYSFANAIIVKQNQEDDEHHSVKFVGHAFGQLFFRPLVVLGFAAVVHYLMNNPLF